MTAITAFIRTHAVVSYFALTFTISWGGVLLVIVGSFGMTGVKAQDHPSFPFAVVARCCSVSWPD